MSTSSRRPVLEHPPLDEEEDLAAYLAFFLARVLPRAARDRNISPEEAGEAGWELGKH